MTVFRSLAIAVIALVGACSMPSLEASPERDREAQALLEDLAADRDEAIVRKMSSGNSEADVRAQLPFIKTLVPDGPPPQGVTRGWRAHAGTGGATYALTRSYDYPDRTLNVDTTFIKEGENWKVFNFHVSPVMKPEAQLPDEAGAESTSEAATSMPTT